MNVSLNKPYYHYIGLITLIYFVVFLKLDSFHIRWWDESLFAVNAYEMLNNGKYFSAFYDGAPDMFNSKPPLTTWVQIIFIKLLGYNELALRLPSSIAAALSVLTLFSFMSKVYNYTWAWLSSLILLTSSGFVTFHTSRTADSDSILTLFLLLSNLQFINYFISNNRSHIFYFILFITLAFCTKMYAALLFSPAYLIILWYNHKLKDFILNKYFISGMLFFLTTCFLIIFLKESDTPGYINSVMYKDAIRIFKVIENHNERFTFYFNNLFSYRFSTWFLLLVFGLVSVFFTDNKQEKKFVFICSLLCIVYLIIISISSTKLEWYDMPLFPYLSVISAYPIYLMIHKLSIAVKPLSEIKIIGIFALIFFMPYLTAFSKSEGNVIPNGEKTLEANEEFIFRKIDENKNLDGIKVFCSGHIGGLLFYKYQLADLGQIIEIVNHPQFMANDKVLVCNDSLKSILATKYIYQVIDKDNNAELVQIKSDNLQ